MPVYLFLAVTLAFVFWSLWLLRSAWRKPVRMGWSAVLLGLCTGAFVYCYGTWLFLSVYLKYGFAAVEIAVVLVSLLALPKQFVHRSAARAAWNVLGSAVFGTLVVLYFTGTRGTPETVDLAFPLKRGRYVVFQGGKGLPANFFHATGRGSVYALDLVKLDRWGRRASAIFSQDLNDYFIYGDTVYAPCAGRIERAVSDNPDNIPPHTTRGPHNLNGVVIRGAACTVFLGHFRPGGVLVDSGAWVTAGQPVGLAGNSGFSLEPHLHLQAHKPSPPGVPWYRGDGLFIRFAGRGYLLGEVISPAALR